MCGREACGVVGWWEWRVWGVLVGGGGTVVLYHCTCMPSPPLPPNSSATCPFLAAHLHPAHITDTAPPTHRRCATCYACPLPGQRCLPSLLRRCCEPFPAGILIADVHSWRSAPVAIATTFTTSTLYRAALAALYHVWAFVAATCSARLGVLTRVLW